MVSEVLVYGRPTPFFGARGEAEHYGGRLWHSKVAQNLTPGRERLPSPQTKYKLQRHTPKDPSPATPYLPTVTIQLIFIRGLMH